jgi:tRNA-2-methylthio-N6-dimethylallyladenosine synthase
MSKKVFLRSFGCQMNIYDSSRLLGAFVGAGWRVSPTLESADVILFNTCSVRKHAEDRVWGKVTELKALKKQHPKKIIGIVGCMAKAHGKAILERLPHVSFVVSPANLPRTLAHVKACLARANAHIVDVDDAKKLSFPAIDEAPAQIKSAVKAYVAIMTGCDNYCSYCVVPYVRGHEVSRKPQEIIDEIKSLVERRAKEVMLLGQNVNSYRLAPSSHARSKDFISLLEKVNAIEGLERIRFMTSHPKDAGDDLFKAMADLPKVCEHLHLPLQSGSDKILKLMNRGYTKKEYARKVEHYRKIVSTGSITTDIIVGFPCETKKYFNETRAMMQDIGFDAAFMFKYSPRPFSKAEKFKETVNEDEKAARLAELLALQKNISRKKLSSCLGTTQEVLIEGLAKRQNTCGIMLKGHTRAFKEVIVRARGTRTASLVGALKEVKIKEIQSETLLADLNEKSNG